MEDYFGFDHIQSMLALFDDIGDDCTEDSGVEGSPFLNYAELDGIIEKAERNHTYSATRHTFNPDKDDLTFIDDYKDADYKPKKQTTTKKGNSKTSKRRQYPNTSVSSNKVLLLTPEKQVISAFDSDSNSNSMRHYARKDRTPNTIKKMMEKHRESERVRHHSLNESLKDVCMRVPGYDPGAKETKVIQMQRIIGYECFLENTFRGLCTQLGAPAKYMLKMNTQFISDALNNTPIEDFYQRSSYKTSDVDDDDEDYDDQDPLVNVRTHRPGRSHGCRLIRSSRIEDNIICYPREKISSPTVDSTTDSIIQLTPVPHMKDLQENPSRYITKEHHCQWMQQTGFKPIDSSQGMASSQESGIKVETQSSLDDDCHFQEVNRLMEEGLYNDSEHLRTVTPSFMREETVTTSTGVEDTDEGFDLSSPVRYTDSVFLQSPPMRGIWHSAGKFQLHDKVDTPVRQEMEGVSPENILETRPKVTNDTEQLPSTSESFQSKIRPMTEILMNTETDSLPLDTDSTVTLNTGSGLDEYRIVPSIPYTDTWEVPGCSQSYTQSNVAEKGEQINNVEGTVKVPFKVLSSCSGYTSPLATQTIVHTMKPAPTKNVKVRIVHASPSQRNVANKLMSSTSVPARSAIPVNYVSPHMSKVVHLSPEMFSFTGHHVTMKENCSPGQSSGHCTGQFVGQASNQGVPVAITQLRKIPVPVMSSLHTVQLPTGSLYRTAELGSPEFRNKRKRYTPFRSPFSDRTNQDSDDDSWTEQNKRLKSDTALYHGQGNPNIVVRSRQQAEMTPPGQSVSNRGFKSSPIKIDHRRSTWMNGFMMFSQLNRQKYLREHPGVHVSVIQKLLGHKWRNMTAEEQSPYKERANQYIGYVKQTQMCTASVADSSTGPQREPQPAGVLNSNQQEVESAVLAITPHQL